jgi:hypothetical protein
VGKRKSHPSTWDSTPDLYFVKLEVEGLQPFSCVAFPFSHLPKTAPEPPIFDDELVTSFVRVNPSTDAKSILCKEVFGTLQNTTGSHLSHDALIVSERNSFGLQEERRERVLTLGTIPQV